MDILISAIATAAISAALISQSERKFGRECRSGTLMSYSRLAVGLAVFSSFGWLTIFVLSMLNPVNRSVAALSNGGVAVAILVIPGFWFLRLTLRTHVIVGSCGLVRLEASGRRTRWAWRDIVRVSKNVFGGWYAVERSDGQVLRLSQLLTGQSVFASKILENVSVECLNCEGQLKGLAR